MKVGYFGQCLFSDLTIVVLYILDRQQSYLPSLGVRITTASILVAASSPFPPFIFLRFEFHLRFQSVEVGMVSWVSVGLG